MTRRSAITGGAVVVVLSLLAWFLPDLRRALIYDVTWWDAAPGDPPQLTGGTGPGLTKTPRTRVVLIDGLSADVTPALTSWRATCRRGLTLRIDVGFPTVSLPVESALWTGLTQQQTGIVHRGGGKGGKYGRPLDPPLDRRGIPAQVPGSIAVAEDHGWIVRSLGFSKVMPAAGAHPADDLDPATWDQVWQREARAAVASPSPLVFVHLLRVDTVGHRFGVGPWYGKTAVEADVILGQLLAADPGARWFVLSDHGHLGGHGGEEREVRQVEACIAGPGVAPANRAEGPLLHVVDIARAIADSTGAKLDAGSHGRPLSTALAAPLGEDQAVPPLDLSRGVVAILLLALALGATIWGARRWWLAPWWFPIACVSLLAVRGEPTMSIGWLYAPEGRLMIESWLPAIGVAALISWLGLGTTTVLRVLAAQLAIPAAALAATITASGAWSPILGGEVSPLVPHYTAYMLVLVLMVAHGAGAVALAVVARLVLPRFGRRGRAAPPRSEP